jgi:hypothetical protein
MVASSRSSGAASTVTSRGPASVEYTEPTRDRWQRGPLNEGEDIHQEEHDIEDSLRAGHSDGDRNCGEHDGDSAT